MVLNSLHFKILPLNYLKPIKKKKKRTKRNKLTKIEFRRVVFRRD